MLKIQIAGSGCSKCAQLYERAEAVAKELGIDYEIEKVTDMNAIIDMGVMMTPALLVNGKVKSAGKLPSQEAMKKFLS
jgi:small redox-active disulfide protein 2